MIAAIYSRKSKFTGKGESIENQIQLCQDYGKTLGVSEFIIYEDEGFSGGNTDRPKYQQLMKDAKSKKFDVLICYRLDRISRNVLDFSNTIELLNSCNIAFISIREQFDTSTPMGRAMMYISSVFAQLERETIAERVRDNMSELAKTGRWLGGTPPYGFKSEALTYVDENMKERKMMKLSPISEDMEKVKELFNLYLEKTSLSKLHKYLYINNMYTRNNAEWTVKNLQLLLRNPVYVKSNDDVISYLQDKGIEVFGEPNGNGILTYNKKDSKDNYKDESEWIYAISKHEGIIDAATWLKVQKQLDENKDKAPRLVSGGYGLLNGILKCAHCGASMHQKMGHPKAGTGEIQRYYVCTNKVKSGATKCKCKNVKLDEIEPKVINALYEKTSDQGELLKDIEEYKKRMLQEDNSEEIKNIETNINKTEKKINNLVEQLSEDNDIDAFIKPKIKELSQELAALKKQRESLMQKSSSKNEILAAIDLYSSMVLNFKPLFEKADYEGKKQLLKTVVDSIYYNSITLEIDVNIFLNLKKNRFLV